MFGARLNTVFASRWKALIWSAGILLTAYCSVPSQEDTLAEQVPVAQAKVADHPHPDNPWALTKKP